MMSTRIFVRLSHLPRASTLSSSPAAPLRPPAPGLALAARPPLAPSPLFAPPTGSAWRRTCPSSVDKNDAIKKLHLDVLPRKTENLGKHSLLLLQACFCFQLPHEAPSAPYLLLQKYDLFHFQKNVLEVTLYGLLVPPRLGTLR